MKTGLLVHGEMCQRAEEFRRERKRPRGRVGRLTLQAVAYQTRALIDAMSEDGLSTSVIRVDGGMVANSWFLQFLADILNIPVERPVNVESTVLGAAYLAAYQSGVIASVGEFSKLWKRDKLFEPDMTADQRGQLLDGWRTAVSRVRSDRIA